MVTLGVCATLAVLSQEQVGLLVAALAVWLWFRHPDRRRAAACSAPAALAWVVIAFGGDPAGVRARGRQPAPQPLLARSATARARSSSRFVTRPWDAVGDRRDAGPPRLRARPAAATLFLALAAPLLAAGGPAAAADQPLRQHGPGADRRVPLRGAAGAGAGGGGAAGAGEPARARPARTGSAGCSRTRRRMAAALVGATLLTGVFLGPLPLWGWVPGGWGGSPLHAFTVDDHARALQRAVDMIPAGRPGLGDERRRVAPVGPRAHPPVPEAADARLGAARRRRPLPRDGARPPDPAPARHVHELAAPAPPVGARLQWDDVWRTARAGSRSTGRLLARPRS